MNKIALFGITANPPHIGHINAIEQIINKNIFDKIFVHVAIAPAWKNDILSYEARFLMTQNLVKEKINNDIVLVSDVECILYKNKNEKEKLYTYEIVEYFQKKFSDCKITLFFGDDNIENISKFKNYEFLKNNCDIDFVSQEKQVHSSDIREMFQKNNVSLIKNLVGFENFKLIEKNKFYNII